MSEPSVDRATSGEEVAMVEVCTLISIDEWLAINKTYIFISGLVWLSRPGPGPGADQDHKTQDKITLLNLLTNSEHALTKVN